MKPAGTPCAVLAELSRGPIKRADMLRLSKQITANQSTSAMALARLQEAGLVVCEYRLTRAGKRALREVAA